MKQALFKGMGRGAFLAGVLALGGGASAQASEACSLQLRGGHSHAMLQASAAPRLAGSYELKVHQDGGNGTLLVDQSGAFTPYNAWPTTLARVMVGAGALRPAQRQLWRTAGSAEPGTTIISGPSTRVTSQGALPESAYGFRARLKIYDQGGNLICAQTKSWR